MKNLRWSDCKNCGRCFSCMGQRRVLTWMNRMGRMGSRPSCPSMLKNLLVQPRYIGRQPTPVAPGGTGIRKIQNPSFLEKCLVRENHQRIQWDVFRWSESRDSDRHAETLARQSPLEAIQHFLRASR